MEKSVCACIYYGLYETSLVTEAKINYRGPNKCIWVGFLAASICFYLRFLRDGIEGESRRFCGQKARDMQRNS